jgi:hypothetical protein
MLRLPLLPIAFLALAACTALPSASVQPSPSQTPAATPSPTSPPAITPSASPTDEPVDHGPAGLVNDLRALGIEAEEASEFAGDPISNLGVQLCVSGEPVQVYVFGTPQEAAAVAGQIDPDDPSNFGTSIIEWAGEPKFWLRDRILVLYLGTEEPVEEALISVLGEPFARGEGRPPLLGGGC